METSTVLAIAGIAVVGLVGYGVVSSMNRQSETRIIEASRQSSGSPLGETGGIIFGSLTGAGNLISSIVRAAGSSSGNKRADTGDPTSYQYDEMGKPVTIAGTGDRVAV